MTKLIVRRLVQMPFILLTIYTLVLTLAWAVPGNPLDNPDGQRPPVEVQEAMKREYNLDNFWKFYGSYLYNATGVRWAVEKVDGSGAERRAGDGEGRGPVVATRYIFDLGPSLKQKDWRVNEIVMGSLPVSIAIGGLAILIALVIGTVAGVVGAIRPNSVLDLATLSVALVGISVPTFVTASVILLIGAIVLGVVQVGVWTGGTAVLAALALSLPYAAYIARLTRMGLIDTMGTDYIRTARAKGVSETRVLLKHALKNAMLPVLSYLGPATALAMTGSFVVERVFNVPGMGQHFVNAVLNKDLFLIIGVVMVFSTMLILFNLAVDVMYRWVDPRIE